MKRPSILSKTGPLPDYIYRSYVEFFRSGRVPPVAVLSRWDDAITKEIFKNLASKMKLCGSTLICVATGLPMVCQEKFEFVVVKVHTRGGHPGPGHRGLLSTCVHVRQKYSIGEANFGIPEAEVRRIALRCPDPDCTHRLWKQKFTTGRWLDVKPIIFHKHDEENMSQQQQPLGAIDLTVEPVRGNIPLDLSQQLEYPKTQLIPGQVDQSMQWSTGPKSPMAMDENVEDEGKVITIDSSPEIVGITSDTATATVTASTASTSLYTEEKEYVDLDELMEGRPSDKPPSKTDVEPDNIQTPRTSRVAGAKRISFDEQPEPKSSALFELLCHNVTKPGKPEVPARHTQQRFVDLICLIQSMKSEIPKVLVENEEALERLTDQIERGLEIIGDATRKVPVS